MQALIAIPDTNTLYQFGGPAQALMRKVCGVPLLVRVIKTTVRAGTDSLLVIWPNDVLQSIWISAQAALAREVLCGIVIVQPEDLSLDRTRTGRRSTDCWTISFSGSLGIG
jgi:hypothetical protein